MKELNQPQQWRLTLDEYEVKEVRNGSIVSFCGNGTVKVKQVVSIEARLEFVHVAFA